MIFDAMKLRDRTVFIVNWRGKRGGVGADGCGGVVWEILDSSVYVASAFKFF